MQLRINSAVPVVRPPPGAALRSLGKLTRRSFVKRLATILPVTGMVLAGFSVAPLVTPQAGAQAQRIHKIQHVIVIMQENRSFDQYFGTYPGAAGFPTQNGQFTVCVPDPATGGCVKPFHDTQDLNFGGPHGASNAVADTNGGKMDGFVSQ